MSGVYSASIVGVNALQLALGRLDASARAGSRAPFRNASACSPITHDELRLDDVQLAEQEGARLVLGAPSANLRQFVP